MHTLVSSLKIEEECHLYINNIKNVILTIKYAHIYFLFFFFCEPRSNVGAARSSQQKK